MARQQIMQQYATHLSEEDVAELARATEGMSGRDLRDIAEQSERRTASKVKHNLRPPPRNSDVLTSGIPVTYQTGQAHVQVPISWRSPDSRAACLLCATGACARF